MLPVAVYYVFLNTTHCLLCPINHIHTKLNMAFPTDILYFIVIFTSLVKCNLNVRQLFSQCQVSDLMNHVISRETTENYPQLRVECQTVTHLINFQERQWDKCYISCQAGYSLKNPHYSEYKIATTYFTCRKLRNSSLFHWTYQDGSLQPELQGCQIDDCPPPTVLRKKFKKSSNSDWECKFYWDSNEKQFKLGVLVLNLVSIRDNLSNFNFSQGWTLILKFNQNISSSENSSSFHSIHISKALNLKSTDNGRVLSFTSNGYNNDMFADNSTNFTNYRRTKFEINFYAGLAQEFNFNQDFNVQNIYLLEGQKTDVRCYFSESSSSNGILKYGTEIEPVAADLYAENLQQCHVCEIGKIFKNGKCIFTLNPATGYIQGIPLGSSWEMIFKLRVRQISQCWTRVGVDQCFL